jgi:ADP-ribose pyrophosphatase YjhB (NUDIX family)/GNAT superfamily N-acetyltransferase
MSGLIREISNVILTRGDTILLGWRGPKRRTYPACWAVPGGHLEPGESPEAAAIREIREELGVEVRILRYLMAIETVDALGTLTFHMFSSSQWEGGEPKAQDDEHLELRWFSLQEACDLEPLALEGYKNSFRLALEHSSSHIRRAHLDERDRIREIRFAVGENRLNDPTRVTDADYRWFTENPGIWVWEEDGLILGFSAADTRDGTIWALFIDPDHEGRGIGRALLAKSCAVLREAGHRTATLTTDPGTRADCFYRKAGWTALEIDQRGEQVFRLGL